MERHNFRDNNDKIWLLVEGCAPLYAPDDPNRPALSVPKGRKGLSMRRRWQETYPVDKMGWRLWLWRPFYHGGLVVKFTLGQLHAI